MAEIVTAKDVGNLLLFIAPGYFARFGYCYRFPRPQKNQFAILVESVVLSFPIILVVTPLAQMLHIQQNPQDAIYVLLLLASGLFLGLVASYFRSRAKVRSWFIRAGLNLQPEISIYAATLERLPANSPVTVEFKNGDMLSGTPAVGPEPIHSKTQELYLTSPAWWNKKARSWDEESAGAGVIVNLSEMRTISLANDPTQEIVREP